MKKPSKSLNEKSLSFLNLIGFLLLTLALVIGLTGCRWYVISLERPTLEEKINELSEMVQEVLIDNGHFDDFQVFPIFFPCGTFSNFLLIEFLPMGFMYVRVSLRHEIIFLRLFLLTLWGYSTTFHPTHVNVYDVSDFFGIKDERKYFFFVSEDDINSTFEFVPAVRRGEKFLNLVSRQLFDENMILSQETLSIRIIHGGNVWTYWRNKRAEESFYE